MNRKIIALLAIISFFLSIFFISETYAKYISSTNGIANISVARWRILVNNNDIRENNTASAVITPIFSGNDNIAENIIAPTSTGYFDLIIDATEADVSFKYKINISVNDNSSVKDLIATDYQINNGSKIPLTKDNQTIENNVMLSQNTSPITIRVYIIWDDSNTATMNNIADTEATKNPNNSAKMNVDLTFTQIAN